MAWSCSFQTEEETTVRVVPEWKPAGKRRLAERRFTENWSAMVWRVLVRNVEKWRVQWWQWKSLKGTKRQQDIVVITIGRWNAACKSDKIINNERVYYFITHNKRDRSDIHCNFAWIAFVNASKRIVFRRNLIFTRTRPMAVSRKKLLRSRMKTMRNVILHDSPCRIIVITTLRVLWISLFLPRSHNNIVFLVQIRFILLRESREKAVNSGRSW